MSEVSKADMSGWDKDVQDAVILAQEWGWSYRWIKDRDLEMKAPDGDKALRFNNGTKLVRPSAKQIRQVIMNHGVDPSAEVKVVLEDNSVAEHHDYGQGVLEAIRAMVAPDMVTKADYDEVLEMMGQQEEELGSARSLLETSQREIERLQDELRDARSAVDVLRRSLREVKGELADLCLSIDKLVS